jgi:hypothetical protein
VTSRDDGLTSPPSGPGGELALIHLLTSLPASRLAALSEWSDVHHPELLGVPGYLSAARYQATTPPAVGSEGEARAEVFTTYVVAGVAAAEVPPAHRVGMTAMPSSVAASLQFERRVLTPLAGEVGPLVGGAWLVRAVVGASAWPEVVASLAGEDRIVVSVWADENGVVLLASTDDTAVAEAVANRLSTLVGGAPPPSVGCYGRVFAATAATVDTTAESPVAAGEA